MARILTSILLLAFFASTSLAETAGQGDGGGKGPGMRGKGQRMAHIQQALGLSQEQVEQIREIRQNGGGRAEVRAVLTDEQRARMDEHRAARQGQGKGKGQGRGNGKRRGPGNPDGQEPVSEEPVDSPD